MGLLDAFKKKKLSARSANFARLIKYFCTDSGIPIQTQLNITKSIARDYIDNSKKEISHFVFMDAPSARVYLIKNGMNEMDADIFWSIIQGNRDSILSI